MITAIVLIKAGEGAVSGLADRIVNLEGVSCVYSVAGRYDLAVIVKVKDHEDLAAVVSDAMRKEEGIAETETLIAFRAYSRRDLEAGFSLGMD